MTSRQFYFTNWQINKSNLIGEIVSTPPPHPIVPSYRIRIKTSNLSDANTNANVFIRLIGETIESADVALNISETNRIPFQIDQVCI